MEIRVVIHKNDDKDRIEYLLVNFEYYDGNKLIAKEMCSKYGMKLAEEKEGLFYNIKRLVKEKEDFFLMWHEDVGNFAYSESQSREVNSELRKILEEIVRDLNKRIKS